MNPTLRDDPAFRELRQLVAELSLISHVTAVDFEGKTAHRTDEDIGGRRPPGTDLDRPRRPGPNADPKVIAEYREDYASWLGSYLRRTPDYFRRELEDCQTVRRLRDLCQEARETLDAWKRMPAPSGRPASRRDPQWKRWVAFAGAEVGDICRWYDVSRQRVHQIRREYRGEDAA